MQPESAKVPWYSEGLRFECARCGKCCSGAPGTVLVSNTEIKRLAAFFKITPAAFCRTYARRIEAGRISLQERPNGECIFYKRSQGCRIYRLRPRQCRSWPFWYSVTRSRLHWAEAARSCPGMNQGKLYSAAHIEKRRKHDGTRGKALPIF